MDIMYKHPIAVFFLLLYSILCINSIRMEIRLIKLMKLHPDVGGIALGGEWGGAGIFLFAAIFSLISCGCAMGNPKQTKFYLGLIVIIIVEAIIVLGFDKFLH